MPRHWRIESQMAYMDAAKRQHLCTFNPPQRRSHPCHQVRERPFRARDFGHLQRREADDAVAAQARARGHRPRAAQAFEDHLQETRNQVERLEQIAEQCGFKLKRIKCDGMEGLVEETMSLVDLIEKGPVLDAALIGSAQKAEHYEIAGYTSLCLLAQKLGFAEALPLLQASLSEEQATDQRLGLLAEAAQIEEATA
jgi:ferritin-like metal-binding protein YciE